MNALIMLFINDMNLSMGYIIGGVIAVLILGYLLYSLVKPEKF